MTFSTHYKHELKTSAATHAVFIIQKSLQEKTEVTLHVKVNSSQDNKLWKKNVEPEY